MSDFNKNAAAFRGRLPRMQYIDDPRLERAERCLWQSARVLERVRFQQMFRGGSRAAVLDALRAYQNSDGGFGHAIEPDFRGPISQPLSTDFGLRVLADLGGEPDLALLRDVLRYAKSITVRDGGVPNTLPSVRAYPRAPWWEPAGDDPPGSLLPTAGYVGLFYAFKLDDPWLASASEFCWQGIARLIERAARAEAYLDRLFVSYESRAATTFLDFVPDRARAERVGAQLGEALFAAKLVQLELTPGAQEAQPLELAPTPSSVAVRWFERKLIDANLDDWVRAQEEQGGWSVSWPITWPVAEHEWRGIYTLDRLKTLRDWGRVRLQER